MYIYKLIIIFFSLCADAGELQQEKKRTLQTTSAKRNTNTSTSINTSIRRSITKRKRTEKEGRERREGRVQRNTSIRNTRSIRRELTRTTRWGVAPKLRRLSLKGTMVRLWTRWRMGRCLLVLGIRGERRRE